MAAAPVPAKSTRPKFVPPFLAKLGIQPGEWAYVSKLAIRALMRPSWPLKIRIWAFLVGQSFGYESDLAVFMRKAERPGGLPKVTALLPHEIIHALDKAAMEDFKQSAIKLTEEQQKNLRISRQHMRRALAEMEEQDGLIVRVRQNRRGAAPKGGQPDKRPFWDLAAMSLQEAITANAVTPLANLSKPEALRVQRKICVYLLPKPRPAKNLADVAKTGYIIDHKPSGISNQLAQLLLPFLARGSRGMAAAVAEHPEVKKLLGQLQATIGKVLTQLQHEDAKPLTNGSNPAPTPAEPGQASSPVSAPANSNGNGHSPHHAKERAVDRDRLVSAAGAESPDVQMVLQAIRKWVPCGPDAALVVLQRCRQNCPSATAVAIIESINLKGPTLKTAGGFICAIPPLFHGMETQIQAYQRQRIADEHRAAAEVDRDEIRAAQRFLASPEGECPYCGNVTGTCIHQSHLQSDKDHAIEVLARVAVPC